MNSQLPQVDPPVAAENERTESLPPSGKFVMSLFVTVFFAFALIIVGDLISGFWR